MRRDPSMLQTLFNLDFHLAVLQANAGVPGYSDWLEHRKALEHEFAEYPELEPLPLHEVNENLDTLRGDYLRHARGVAAMALTLARKEERDDDLKAWVEVARRLYPGAHDDLLSHAKSAPCEPFEAYSTAVFASTGLRPGCVISKPVMKFSFDTFQVTTVSVSFSVNRPIDDFRKPYDPRMWDHEVPEAFEQSDRIADTESTDLVPGESALPPPPRLPNEADEILEAGTTLSFPLYENAVTIAGGGRNRRILLTEFRNILSIDYQSEAREIRMTYDLSEAITFILGDQAHAGGLDRDSGTATIVARGSGVHIEASKSLRISRPAGLRNLLNSNMAAILPFWFLNLVMLGACSPSR